MSSIAAITTQRGTRAKALGLRRAVVTRRALLGDCASWQAHARTLFSRQAWERPACVVPLRSSGLRDEPTASDLALDTARQLLASQTQLPTERVGSLIYCHDAPDEHMSASTAGRLQHELALPGAHPFAIAQAHNSAPWIALDLALGLIEGPERAEHVLLVASDKLVYGGPASDARALRFCDVATAALVSRSDAAGWRVEQVALHHFDTPHDALTPWPAPAREAFARFGADAVGELLADAGVAPDRLHTVLPVCADTTITQALHRRAGLPKSGPMPAALTPTQWLFELSAMQDQASPGQTVLAWSAGNNGEFACGLLRRI